MEVALADRSAVGLPSSQLPCCNLRQPSSYGVTSAMRSVHHRRRARDRCGDRAMTRPVMLAARELREHGALGRAVRDLHVRREHVFGHELEHDAILDPQLVELEQPHIAGAAPEMTDVPALAGADAL